MPIKKVHFYFHNRKYSLRDRSGLSSAIEDLFTREKKKLQEINYVFCSDEHLLDINRTYLKHDYYTDIITFDISEPGDPISGEIYISLDRVKENAMGLNVSMKEELCRVVFHGALHLCGYKDKKKREVKKMRAKEDYYLSGYLKKLPRSTA